MKRDKIFILKILFGFIFLVLIVGGFFYLKSSWKANRLEIENQASLFARSGAISFDGEMLKLLQARKMDIGTVAYESIKNRLIKLAKLDESVVFIYLYTKRGNELYFLVDSEARDSEDISLPGDLYSEAEIEYHQAFDYGKIIITDPLTDRWGTWISVLVPIANDTGQIQWVLGVDYTASEWQREIFFKNLTPSLLVLLVLIVFSAFYLILKSLFLSRKIKDDLAKVNDRYESLTRESRSFIWEVDLDAKYKYVSQNIKDIIGYSPKELVDKKTVFDLHPKDGLEEFKAGVFDVFKKGKKLKGLENPIVTKGGKIVWVLSYSWPILDKKGKCVGYQGYDMDITERKNKAEETKNINNFMIGRELKMIELKNKIKELKQKNKTK